MSLTTLLYDWQYRARQWATGRLYRMRARPAARPLTGEEPRRVLLVLAGLLGDTVMSTPVMIESRRLWPRAHLTVLGRRHNCELLSACPLIDACIEASAVPFTLRRRREISKLKQWLRDQCFDLAIILLGDQFAAVLAEAGIPVRVGVRGHLLEPCLTHSYDAGTPRTWGPSERLNALRVLGHAVCDVAPRLWVAEAARQAARQKLAELGLAESDAYAVIHPFGSTPRQWWPLERVGELAQVLHDRHGLQSIVIGGPETRNRLPASLRGSVLDATGAFTLAELLGVMAEAGLVISTDSGPFHIAGALGRPLIGLFRARRPEHAGRYPKARAAFGQEPSCQARCRWDRCQAQPCRQLAALTVDQVVSLIGARETSPAAAACGECAMFPRPTVGSL